MMKLILSVGAFFGVQLFCVIAQAGFVLNVTQTGNDVVVQGSGSANIAALNFLVNTSWSTPAIDFQSIRVGSGLITIYSGYSGPVNFGPGPSGLGVVTSNVTGLPFGVDASRNRLFVPRGYISGTELSSTSTYSDKTLAGLGLAEGVYQLSWGSGLTADTMTVNVSVSAVPEPTSALLFLTSCTACIGVRRRLAKK